MTSVQDEQSVLGSTAQSLSPTNAFTGDQDGPQPSGPRLLRSLKGFLPETQCYAALASYPGQIWSDGSDMSISPECVVRDVKRIGSWMGRFNRAFMGYHDIPDACGRKGPEPEPTAENIRRFLEEPRELPTCIYISGHTDSSGGERFYITSDSVVNGVYDTSRVIYYSEFREKLLLEHHQEPVMLVTDMCECDNFMKLPYVYAYENGRVTCTKTEYHTGAEWDSVDVVQFAATSPDQGAAFFSYGSVFNLALHNVPLEKKPSLEEIVEFIQIDMGDQLRRNPKTPAQTHRVYSSRKFDGEDFFGTMGFSIRN